MTKFEKTVREEVKEKIKDDIALYEDEIKSRDRTIDEYHTSISENKEIIFNLRAKIRVLEEIVKQFDNETEEGL